jgi:prepilin-type N-terminal cleavage/methylation domain-containing protein/prepilin-type processing-associated H-X9-DG protein
MCKLNNGEIIQSKMGFTLIELLVVIAIIAILAAILFPVFASARASARTAKCQSNMKQISAAALMYADDYKGWTPPPIYGYLAWGQAQGNGIKGWTEVLAPYMKQYHRRAPKKGEAKVYVCPEQRYNYSYGIDWWYDGCPASPYGPADKRGITGGNANNRGFNIGIVMRPTKMIFFYELRPYWNETDTAVTNSNNNDSGLSNDDQPDIPCYYHMNGKVDSYGGKPSPWWLTWPGVHNGGNNLVFTDGHVKWFKDWADGRMTFRADTP